MKKNKKFEDFLKKTQPGDLIFFRDKSIISKTIRWFSKGKWSHVETVTHRINSYEYKDSIMISARELDGGVVSSWLLSNSVYREDLELLLMRPKSTAAQREKQIGYLISCIGQKYDYKYIKSYIINKIAFWREYKIKDDPDKFFCSEVTRDALMAGRIIRHKEKTTKPTPAQLAKYPELEEVARY